MIDLDPLISSMSDIQRREWVKYQLRLRGTSLSAIAREQGLSRTTVRAALDKPYPRMEALIAEKMGLHPAQIWPERYRPDGTPKSGHNERGIGRHPSNLKGAKTYKPKGTNQRKTGNVKRVDTPSDTEGDD